MMKSVTMMSAGMAMLLSACAAGKPATAADLTAALNVAAAAEAAYAAHPGANPANVAQMAQLLSAAQAALFSWSNAKGTADQTAVGAAIAALIAYEAAAKST